MSNFVYFNLSKQLDIHFTREFLLDIIYVAAYDSGMLIKTYFLHSDTGPEGGLGGL